MDVWPTDSDLQAYASVPPDPRAVVLLLHGFGEHAGRHAPTVLAFARRGIAVYAYDQRGHGRSPGPRALVSGFTHFVDDSLAMRGRVHAAHPGLPLFLLGASMGGLIAIHSALRDGRGLAGVVLVSPALAVGGSTPQVVRALGSIFALAMPSLPVASVDADALSRDRAVVAAFVADPLVHHGKISARTGAEVLTAAAAAIAAAPRWRLPAYIIIGEDDRIAAPAGARRFAQAAISADLTLRTVVGGYHEPFGEPGGAALIDEAATWILERAQRAPSGAGESLPTRDAALAAQSVRVYTWREGLAFGAAINVVSRLLGTNTGRYESIKRPWFAPPGWVFPVVWGINNVLAINGNLRVLNAPPSTDRTAYLRLWAATWILYVLFGYGFFRRKSPLLGLLDTVNFLVLAILSARRAVRIERRLWLTYSTLLPWLTLAVAVALAVALENPDPLLDPPESEGL